MSPSAKPVTVTPRIARGRRPDPKRSSRVDDVQRLVDGGSSVSEACRLTGVAPASYYRWRNREVSDRVDDDAIRKIVIDAAKAAFRRHGMDVSLALIAEMAGVGRQTVYNLYGNKKALLLDVLRDVYGAFLVLDHEPADDEPLEAVLDLFGQRFMAMAVDEHALMVNRLTIGQYSKDPEISGMIFDLARRNSLTGLTSRLAVYLARQQALGRVGPGDPELMAEVYRSAVTGTVRLRALAGIEQSSETLAAHLSCAIAVFLKGLAASSRPG